MSDDPPSQVTQKVTERDAQQIPTAHRTFRALFAAEGSYVWNSLRRLGVGERDLEDVTHEVMIAVYQRLNEYDPSRPIRPWLFAFAVRFASDYRRLVRHEREVLGQDSSHHQDPAPAPEEQLAAEQSRRLVIDALDTLDMDRRAVLVMHDLDGHAMPDIALALGIPVNTAYTRLRAARGDFKAAVQRLRLRRGEP